MECRIHLLKTAFTSLLVAGSMLLARPALSDEAPRLIKVRLKGGYLDTDGRYEEYKRTTTNTDYYDRRFLQIRPNVGLDLDGSIYHSNLIDYNLSMELGWNYEYERLIEPAAADPDRSRSDASPLQFYRGHALILKEKKLSGNVFGNYNLVRRDNDFFTRQTLYQGEYGAKMDYSGDTIPWILTATRHEEEETDSPAPRSSQRDEISFNASNNRGPDQRTRLKYLYQDFTNQEYNTKPYDGIRNMLRVNDNSYLFAEALILNSFLYVNDIESTAVPSSTFSLRETLHARHTSSLSSIYKYNYSTRDSGSTESVSQDAEAAVRHQLYRSLTSTLSVDARDTSQTSQDIFRYGVTLNESYSKHIGDHSMLTLGALFRRHEEERVASEGDTIDISNEPHILSTGTPAFLNQPDVIASSIVVRDVSGIVLYREFSDYLIIQRGSVTEIERVVGGDIPDGSTVHVSYTAANPGSGSFETRQNTYRFRYYLLNQLLAVYGHIRKIDNQGGEQFTLEDVDERILGIESSWKGFRIGAEYQDYESSLLSHETLRLFENFSFPLSWKSMITLSANQSWIYYPETNEDLRRYFHNIVYRNQLTPRLSFNVGGSLYIQRSDSDELLDRDLLAVNTRLNYKVGKTTISALYEYRHEETRPEKIQRQTAYLRVRRRF